MKVYLNKTRVPGLLVGENRMIIWSLVLSQQQRVTDRQTDRHAAYSYVAL